MKDLRGNENPDREKRPDFGDAIISNAHYDCNKCALKKVDCKFIPNSIHCVVAVKRLRKLIEEEQEKTETNAHEETMADEEKKAVQDFLQDLTKPSDKDKEDDDD